MQSRRRFLGTFSLPAAAAALEGRHDFASFANAGSSPGASTVRSLHALRWSPSGDEVHLDAVGDGFLYKMVRTLVGTLLREAQQADPAAAAAAVLAARDRSAAGPVAPASGLTLKSVAVSGETPRVPLPAALQSCVDSSHEPSTGGSP